MKRNGIPRERNGQVKAKIIQRLQDLFILNIEFKKNISFDFIMKVMKMSNIFSGIIFVLFYFSLCMRTDGKKLIRYYCEYVAENYALRLLNWLRFGPTWIRLASRAI